MNEQHLHDIFTRLNSLEQCHAGERSRNSTLWEVQHGWNREHDSDHRQLEFRVNAIEKHIARWAGAAALAGALLGSLGGALLRLAN